MRLGIRPALETEFAFCESLTRANMARYHTARGIAWDRQRFRDSWARFDNAVVTADDHPAGLLRLLATGGALEIRDLQLLPAFRRLGIGTWAIAQAASRAGRLGLAELRLRVYAENPARHLYARLGFEADANDGDVIQMSLALPPRDRTRSAG